MPNMGFIPGPGDSGTTSFERALKTLGYATQLQRANEQAGLENRKLQNELQIQGLNQQLLQFQLSNAPKTFEMQQQAQMLGLQTEQLKQQNLMLDNQLGQVKLDEETSPLGRFLRRSTQVTEILGRGAEAQNLMSRSRLMDAQAEEQKLLLEEHKAAEAGIPDAMKAVLRQMPQFEGKTDFLNQMSNLKGEAAREALKTGMESLLQTASTNKMLATTKERARAETIASIRDAMMKEGTDKRALLAAGLPMANADEQDMLLNLAGAESMVDKNLQELIDSGASDEVIGSYGLTSLVGSKMSAKEATATRLSDDGKNLTSLAQQFADTAKRMSKNRQEKKQVVAPTSQPAAKVETGYRGEKFSIYGGVKISVGVDGVLAPNTEEDAKLIPPGVKFKNPKTGVVGSWR